MNKNLTVILPVHNAEATLTNNVNEVLEVAGELSTHLRLFIVDDGSTDDTYDTATELATRYPQIRVVRHAVQQGLGAAIESLRHEVAGDMVLVHDGASPVEAAQISQLWMDEHREVSATDDRAASVDDLRSAAAVHAAMQAAHGRLAGFQRISVATDDESQLTRRDTQAKSGVGAIPPLPRPNFMGALANFALGE